MSYGSPERDRPARRVLVLTRGAHGGRSKGQLEAEIAESVVAYCRECAGRGPEWIKATLLDDLLIISQHGTFSPSEVRLAATPDGWELVSQSRRRLADLDRDELSDRIARLTGRSVSEVLSDTSRRGLRVDVFVLAPDGGRNKLL